MKKAIKAIFFVTTYSFLKAVKVALEESDLFQTIIIPDDYRERGGI
ncbi:MAG: hypothetical protein ABIJ52_15785 [Pseudomonadota bacterium]